MEQKGFLKNITSTVCVCGLALSTISYNSTLLVSGNFDSSMAICYSFDENFSNPSISEPDNIYLDKNATNLELEAESMFGKMRDATQEERKSINVYINSISVDTGVNFYNIC